MTEAKLDVSDTDDRTASIAVPLLSDWLWRPWYAKLWWAVIPPYWIAIAEPIRPAPLDWYVHSGFAAYMHALFSPIVALVVLGAGYVREANAAGLLGPYERRRGPIVDFDPSSSYSISRRNRERIHQMNKRR